MFLLFFLSFLALTLTRLSAPKWFSQYRFYLSIIVGTSIIATLAGTNYFGPPETSATHSASGGSSVALMERNVKDTRDRVGSIVRTVSKDLNVQTESAGEGDGGYVKLVKKQDEPEKEKENGGKDNNQQNQEFQKEAKESGNSKTG